jgi:hypothetical protein
MGRRKKKKERKKERGRMNNNGRMIRSMLIRIKKDILSWFINHRSKRNSLI